MLFDLILLVLLVIAGILLACSFIFHQRNFGFILALRFVCGIFVTLFFIFLFISFITGAMPQNSFTDNCCLWWFLKSPELPSGVYR